MTITEREHRAIKSRDHTHLTTDFCLDAVNEAIHRYGTPEIFNTDQGSQFTSIDFTTLLRDNGIKISSRPCKTSATQTGRRNSLNL